MHDEAPRAEDTDWPQILALYGVLERMSDNPMVTLNRAIAAAMVHGPAAGLELLETLDADARLAGHYRLVRCARTSSRWREMRPRSNTTAPPRSGRRASPSALPPDPRRPPGRRGHVIAPPACQLRGSSPCSEERREHSALLDDLVDH